MKKIIKKISVPLISLLLLLNMSSAGIAETTVSAEVGFVFNTLLFLICGFLVMFMAAGFAMLELSLIHISEPTRRTPISYAVFCLKKNTRA